MERKYQNFNHFGHEHILVPLVLDEGDELFCKACELIIVEPFHGCLSCNYYLHDKCLNIPRSLLYPSHPDHPLTLIPIPTYPSSSFSCNACGSQGHGFSYSCAHCEFDIHVQCASLPAKVKVLDLHQHELKLAFEWVVQDCRKYYSSFKCDACDYPLESEQWRYYCPDCDFGAHLGCMKIDHQDMGLTRHSSPEGKISGLDGKSGTAQAVLLAKMLDDVDQKGVEELELPASVAKLVKYL